MSKEAGKRGPGRPELTDTEKVQERKVYLQPDVDKRYEQIPRNKRSAVANAAFRYYFDTIDGKKPEKPKAIE